MEGRVLLRNASQQLRTVLRWKWMILAITLTCGVTSYLVSVQLPKTYASSAVALVNPRQSITPTNVTDAQQLPSLDQVVSTYAALINSEPVRQRLVAAGVPRSTGQLAGEISAATQSNTTLIDITVTDPEPAVTQLIARDVVPSFNAALAQLQAQVQGADQGSRLQAMVPWSVPSGPPREPISPNIPRNVAIAALAGLAGAVALAYLFERLDNTVKTEADVVDRLGVPVLGSVRSHRVEANGGLPRVISATHEHDMASEQYRALRTNVLFSGVEQALHSLLITSTMPGEGKTTTACNLAVAMAQAGNRVILVDCDFRRPELHHLFGLADAKGLGNLMLGDSEVDDVLYDTAVANLRVMPAGLRPYNPSELLGSAAMQRILSGLTAKADIVILDSPPVAAVTDPTVLGTLTDGSILVIEGGRTSIPDIARAVSTLRGVNVPLIGAIINKARASGTYTYYYSRNGSHPPASTPTPPPRRAAVPSGGEPSGPGPTAGTG